MTETSNLPELIVVATARDRQFVERQIAGRLNIHCVAVSGGVAGFMGRAVARAIVHGDVNLDQDFHGEGSLRSILRSRMVTFGDQAILIQLP